MQITLMKQTIKNKHNKKEKNDFVQPKVRDMWKHLHLSTSGRIAADRKKTILLFICDVYNKGARCFLGLSFLFCLAYAKNYLENTSYIFEKLGQQSPNKHCTCFIIDIQILERH